MDKMDTLHTFYRKMPGSNDWVEGFMSINQTQLD